MFSVYRYRISLDLGKVAPAARRSGLAITVAIVFRTGRAWAVINRDKRRRLGRILRYLTGPLPHHTYLILCFSKAVYFVACDFLDFLGLRKAGVAKIIDDFQDQVV